MPDLYSATPSHNRDVTPTPTIVDRDQGKKETAGLKPEASPKGKSPFEKKSEEFLPQGGSLSAFVVKPASAHLSTQEEGEQIVVLLRRHWVTNLSWVLATFLMILAPLIVAFSSSLSFLPGRFQIMAAIIWYLLIITFVFERFLSWYFNVYIVTDKRVVDLDFYQLFSYSQSQANLSEITNMRISVSGFSRLFLDFGDLVIETAGESPNLHFERVPNPRRVMDIIEDLR